MTPIKRSCVTLFTAVLCFGVIGTDSAYQLFEDGNTFYADGNYKDAIRDGTSYFKVPVFYDTSLIRFLSSFPFRDFFQRTPLK